MLKSELTAGERNETGVRDTLLETQKVKKKKKKCKYTKQKKWTRQHNEKTPTMGVYHDSTSFSGFSALSNSTPVGLLKKLDKRNVSSSRYRANTKACAGLPLSTGGLSE